MWTGAKQRNFSLTEVSKLLSANPAKVVGFDKFKGTIREGMDADFVIWNPEDKFIVGNSYLLPFSFFYTIQMFPKEANNFRLFL